MRGVSENLLLFFERRITMTAIYFDRTHVRSAAPDLYGLFFEDINRSSDSGLYPEMIETDPLRTVFRLLVRGKCGHVAGSL